MPEKIGIIGSGIVGRSWAMLFAGAGFRVELFDIESSQVDGALKEIAEQLESLEKSGNIRGNLKASQQVALIKGTTSLAECVANAYYIQECVPEKFELKFALYKQIDDVVGPDTIIGSSTSTFLPSKLSKDMKHRDNVIVAHPVNPVYFVPMVEVVPSPWTKPEVFTKTRDLMKKLGEVPVCMKKEIEGFALNRIQYAILNECWNLVTNGYLDVQDMDNVISKGLGLRYAFIGPLETAHLNAHGMKDYCERYSKTIHEVSMTLGAVPKFEGPGVEEISRQLEAMTPLDKLQERCNWRNECLAKLAKLKKEIGD